MKKLVLSIAIALTLLSGCAHNETKNPPTITAKVTVDPELLIGCPKLEQLTMPEPQYEDIASSYLTTIGLYGKCALKQEAGMKAIKRLANIEGNK